MSSGCPRACDQRVAVLGFGCGGGAVVADVWVLFENVALCPIFNSFTETQKALQVVD